MSELKLDRNEEERALEIHEKSIIVDCLQASIFTYKYFNEVLRAGVTVVHKTVATSVSLSEAIRNIADWYLKLERHKDKALLALKMKEIYEAKRSGKLAFIFGLQDTLMIENKVELLDIFYKLGIRIIQLTYNEMNLVGCGCGEKYDCGLSNFGIKVIDRMNKLNMAVDISHVSDKTSIDAIDHSNIVICSHANSRRICNNVRNKSDEIIMALAEKDGVIGVNAFPSFVKKTKMEIGERPTINDLLDHIDYIVNLVGINHAGLGLDFIDNWPLNKHKLLLKRTDIWGKPNHDGIYRYPMGIEHVGDIINITKGLVSRGYSNIEIRKILGENWLRVIRNLLK